MQGPINHLSPLVIPVLQKRLTNILKMLSHIQYYNCVL